MSATELTPEQSALYSQQSEPQHITQVDILGEKGRSLVVAFSSLPGLGETIYLSRLNGDTDVLDIVGVTHWAVEVMPGQTKFDKDSLSRFVDATITCSQSSISEQKRKELWMS